MKKKYYEKIKYIIKLQYVINQIYTNLVEGDRLLTQDHSLEWVQAGLEPILAQP
jgi:hypothetical protein